MTCGISYCQEPHVGNYLPKRCWKHREDRIRKQKATAELPSCNRPGCKEKSRNDLCGYHQKIEDEENMQYHRYKSVCNELDGCLSLEDLKEFILDHLLHKGNF